MKLIFIHGRAQGGKDQIVLKNQWTETLKAGLAKSGLQLPISYDKIVFPFYGDELDKLIADIDLDVEDVIQKSTGSNSDEAKFFYDFLIEIARNANVSKLEIAEEATQETVEKGPLNWGWVQAILRAIDRKGRWGITSLKQFTYDVYLYLTNPYIKDEINTIVRNVIDDTPCVIVGHSLGSVVGYNVLRDNPALNACKYITVGSPLGVSAVKQYLKTPIKMPDCIKKGWYNAYDDRDVVALNSLDKNYFDISPAIVNNNNIDNQTRNRHGIEGYLNDKDVACEIYKALTDGCS